ncbi:Sodium:sulfate symporter transmembrane region family protein [Histomonas meleagridis]|uniref:Sodium:sulfate symporter transmembrane region family protein n=1 Tax=Histomonas meleagridis TaxID=135588 RepID=UPI00355A1382|nr:Sodium:sulfate symporter transmembrane region family protein [Histomonas meleagridis]
MEDSTLQAPLLLQSDSELSAFTTENLTVDTPPKQKVSFLPLIAGLIFGVVYIIPILKSYPTEHTCLALLITVAFLWSTEGLPAYASAYLIPIICVWFGVGIDSETRLRISASTLASTFAWKFMDPIIFVFFRIYDHECMFI